MDQKTETNTYWLGSHLGCWSVWKVEETSFCPC